MGNAKTEHSKQLRSKSARLWREKTLKEGGIHIGVVLKKEEADVIRHLVEHEGSSKKAIEFLVNFYLQHEKKS